MAFVPNDSEHVHVAFGSMKHIAPRLAMPVWGQYRGGLWKDLRWPPAGEGMWRQPLQYLD